VQAAEHSLAGSRVVVLHESRGEPEFGELVRAKNFHEKPALVFKNLGVSEHHKPVQMLRFDVYPHANYPLYR
jgi:hypothetical protein